MKINKIIVLLIIFSLIPTYNVSGFFDVENSWYKSSIIKLKDDGIIVGFEDGNFHPDNNITRAEMLSIILNSSETQIDENVGDSCFPDLVKGLWYVKYICYANENDIAHGYEDGNFKPNGNVSVLELLALSIKAYNIEVPEGKPSDPWYVSYIKYANDNKIIPENAYTINTTAKRGQATQVVTRIQELKQGKTLNYNSEGCNNPKSLNEINIIKVNNKDRSYIINLPDNYDGSNPYPLVIGLHGRTNSNEMVQDYMGLEGGKWNRKSSNNVIAAYPAGLGEGPYTWDEKENIDFFDAMISEISDSFCVDKSQIDIVGHSLGAYFSNKLACLRGDVVNSMTAVGGYGYKSECTGPVASLILHNEDDKLVKFSGGIQALEIRKEVNSCKGTPENIDISGLSCQIRNQCSTGNSVAFCKGYETYGNAPHSRPKKGAEGIYKFIEIL